MSLSNNPLPYQIFHIVINMTSRSMVVNHLLLNHFLALVCAHAGILSVIHFHIPRVIHQVWLSDEAPPASHMETWRCGYMYTMHGCSLVASEPSAKCDMHTLHIIIIIYTYGPTSTSPPCTTATLQNIKNAQIYTHAVEFRLGSWMCTAVDT